MTANTSCPVCMSHECGHQRGQPGCGHYMCRGVTNQATRNSCPGAPAAIAVVKAKADAIKNTVMTGISPEARAAVHRLQHPDVLDDPDRLPGDIGTALTGIMDAFPAEGSGARRRRHPMRRRK